MVLFGEGAGQLLAGAADDNVAIGYNAFDAADGTESFNIAIGYNALGAANGNSVNNCVAIGDAALSAAATHANEIAIGEDAMVAWTGAGSATDTAGYNIAIGGNAMDSNTSGARNIAIGYDALGDFNRTDNDESYNIAIGHDAG